MMMSQYKPPNLSRFVRFAYILCVSTCMSLLKKTFSLLLLCVLRRMLCTRVCMNWSIRRTSRSSGETCTGLWILLPLLHLPSPRTPPKVITLSSCTGLLSGPSETERPCLDWIQVYSPKHSLRGKLRYRNNIWETGIYKEVVFFF